MDELIRKLEEEDRKPINRLKHWWYWSTPGLICTAIGWLFSDIKRYHKKKCDRKKLEELDKRLFGDIKGGN